MRKLFVVCLALLLWSLAASAQEHETQPTAPKTSWVKFTFEEGHFSAMFPVQPQTQISPQPSPVGTLTVNMFSAKGDNESFFMISFLPFPPNYNFNVDRELDATRESFLKALNGTLVNSRRTTINKFAAVEFTAQTEKFDIKSRVFLVNRSLYQIVYASQKGLQSTEDLNRFFESLEIQP